MRATYQTIKLGRGKHTSAADGACVMELASMLAGEPFTDHPVSACPLIGALLRAYNDALDDERRQDLYVYASDVVGSRSSRRLERLRGERVRGWIAEVECRRFLPLGLPEPLRRFGPRPSANALAARVMRAIANEREPLHSKVLALIDELLALGHSSPSRESTQTLTATGLGGGLTASRRSRSSPDRATRRAR